MGRITGWPLAAAALALVLVGCSGDKNGQKEDDAAAELEGVWHVESAMAYGKPRPQLVESDCTFAGDELTIKNPVLTTEETFVIDPAASPKTIDITSQIGDESETRLGIYEIEGDTLRICNRAGDKERPTEFQSTREGGELLLVLKKGPSTNQEGSMAAQMKRLMTIGLAAGDRVAKGDAPFMSQAIRDEDGNPLLSWRVTVLPEMGEKTLYDQFHLNEPWDSEHNKALLEKMPDVYKSAGVEAPGMTSMMVFTGEGTPFGGPEPPDFGRLYSGSSYAILAVQAGPDKAVPWTKPDDLPLVEEDPIAALGDLTDDFFPVVFFDGVLRALPKDIDPVTLRLMIRPEPGVRLKVKP